MHSGQFLFSQVMDFSPWYAFNQCVRHYQAVAGFVRSAARQIVSLRVFGGIYRNKLAKVNEKRDWRVYAVYAQRLIANARPLYGLGDSELILQDSVCTLDSSTIDLCHSVFPWVPFRKTKSGI